jgi:hypothetical protein
MPARITCPFESCFRIYDYNIFKIFQRIFKPKSQRARYVLCYIECMQTKIFNPSRIELGYDLVFRAVVGLWRNHCRDIRHINVVNSQAEERFILITFAQTSNIIHVCNNNFNYLDLH